MLSEKKPDGRRLVAWRWSGRGSPKQHGRKSWGEGTFLCLVYSPNL